MLATSVRDEAAHPAEVEVPAPSVSDVDVTEEAAVDEFMVISDDVSDDAGGSSVITNDEDMGGDDFAVTEEEIKEEA